jgi:hypothetical protein
MTSAGRHLAAVESLVPQTTPGDRTAVHSLAELRPRGPMRQTLPDEPPDGLRQAAAERRRARQE